MCSYDLGNHLKALTSKSAEKSALGSAGPIWAAEESAERSAPVPPAYITLRRCGTQSTSLALALAPHVGPAPSKVAFFSGLALAPLLSGPQNYSFLSNIGRPVGSELLRKKNYHEQP